MAWNAHLELQPPNPTPKIPLFVYRTETQWVLSPSYSGKVNGGFSGAKRAKRHASRLQYYPNSVATFQLLISAGDIASNPGLALNMSKNKRMSNRNISAGICLSCEKTVRKNQKSVLCEVCISLTHARCSGIASFKVKQVRADTLLTWTCGQCLVSLLPFHTCSELDTTTDTSLDESVVDNIQEILSSNCSNLKVINLNTQAMTSTFNEFLLTIKTYPMDVALLSETWLRDQKELLDYVSIDGYATEFGHRVATKGGGVGGYIKENVAYRRRFDIEKTQPDLEQLWLELPGRNKHSKLLLGVIYRSGLLMTASYWLECFENLLSHITSTWDGMVVRTGDINFDLIGRPDSLVTRDINTLDMFAQFAQANCYEAD